MAGAECPEWHAGLWELDGLDTDRRTQLDVGPYRGDRNGNLLAGLTTPGFLLGILRTLTITDPNNPNNTQKILNIPLLLRAFQGDTDVNILSTPNLLTTDNEEAEI